ncbi:uncharacterized protein LOC127847293 isoform X2 [Dreissena polymorpha]|uniref:Uncharacterized protein n=2 Tax=Dreissena polymorpha TaxID=45954 RepID=A0A9D4DGJ0_DREPO|nr:uncharacterized protein LOC127847293 isoform X2 [Dreissena polymorpha]KAH3749237.1 hypothetical protein DPMN_183730 [Dreissena polymorpha]
MKKLQENKEACIDFVQSSYDEQLYTIQETRRKINATLDTIEQKTLTEMKDTLTKLQASSKSDVDKCIRLWEELKQLREAIQDLNDKSRLGLSFIANKKGEAKIKQSETFLKKSSLQVKVLIRFQPNSDIVQYLSKLPGLGRIDSTQTLMVQEHPNNVLTVQGKSVHNVRISSDSDECKITAICVLQDGQFLVADSNNKKVKLFDKQYQVVSHWSASAYPRDMCPITPSEVAVNVDGTNTHEVQFISVDNMQLVAGRTLQLQHSCCGVTFHQGDLYMSCWNALYKNTLSENIVCKMYEDTSGSYTVYKCAVSPTGDKLYITNYSHNKLLTLARDGSVLATFTDHALINPNGVHMTPAGQVLVCGYWSHNMLQMDNRGRRKLATLVTLEDGVECPMSACYNRHTASIIVGLDHNSSILVFKVE